MDDQKSHQGLNRRIAIIGAGAAGLSAAQALKNKGYQQVTIFERADRVGGKCCTVEIDGRNYELGANVLAEDNLVVLALAREFNVPISRVRMGRSSIVDGVTGQPLPKRNFRQMIRLIGELVIYRWLTWKYRIAGQPGLNQLDAALSVPFSEFAKKYHIENLAREFSLFFTGFGYDYYEQISAAYVLKYYRWSTLMAFLRHQIYYLPGGIQHLWTAVSTAHDVRLNTIVTHIERSDKVRITTLAGTEEFEILIIASPLDEALNYLDASAPEQKLFSKIKYVDYCTVACSVAGLAEGDGYVPSNFTSDRAGHPVFWHQHHAKTNVYTFYALANGQQSDDELLRHVTDLIKKMGGTLRKNHSITHWKYFPHVSPEEMRAGFFDQLEALQGARHTFYVGESLNFSTVGLAAEYADALVQKL